MAKECFDSCPFLRDITDKVESDNVLSGPLPFHPDLFSSAHNVDRLLVVGKASYECGGPREVVVEVKKGLFRKRVVSETRLICGIADKLNAEPKA